MLSHVLAAYATARMHWRKCFPGPQALPGVRHSEAAARPRCFLHVLATIRDMTEDKSSQHATPARSRDQHVSHPCAGGIQRHDQKASPKYSRHFEGSLFAQTLVHRVEMVVNSEHEPSRHRSHFARPRGTLSSHSETPARKLKRPPRTTLLTK